MNKIFYDDEKTARVNELLIQKTGVSLFTYAQIFANAGGDVGRRLRKITPEELEKRIGRLEKAQQKLISCLRDVFPDDHSIPGPVVNNELMLIEHSHLGPFLDYVKGLREGLSYTTARKLGPGLNVKSLVAAQWGGAVKPQLRRGCWPILTDLYEWIWCRIKQHAYYEPLAPSEADPEGYLRTQYTRYKNHHWANNTWGNNPNLFSWGEGLTLLLPSACLGDGPFMLFAIFLTKELGPDPVSPAAQDGFARARSLYEQHGFHLSEFESLGPNNKIPSPKLPPLIIFPDGSYFSTGF